MALLKCRKNSHSIIVTFSGDTTVKLAYRIKSALLRVLQEPVGHFRLDLSQITDTDVTFIQMLIALNNSLQRDDRRLSITGCAEDSPVLLVSRMCGIDMRSLFEFEG